MNLATFLFLFQMAAFALAFLAMGFAFALRPVYFQQWEFRIRERYPILAHLGRGRWEQPIYVHFVRAVGILFIVLGTAIGSLFGYAVVRTIACLRK